MLGTKIDFDKVKYHQVSAAINPGNSGGPVFDVSGDVVGIMTLKSKREEAIAFAIPPAEIQRHRQTAIDKSRQGRQLQTVLHDSRVLFKQLELLELTYVVCLLEYNEALQAPTKQDRLTKGRKVTHESVGRINSIEKRCERSLKEKIASICGSSAISADAALNSGVAELSLPGDLE